MTACCSLVTVNPNLGSGSGAISQLLPRGPINSTELGRKKINDRSDFQLRQYNHLKYLSAPFS